LQDEKYIEKVLLGNLKGRHHVEKPEMGGNLILEQILGK
jgi:hypothetical protein